VLSSGRLARDAPHRAQAQAGRRLVEGTTVEARSAFSRLARDGNMTARGLRQAVARLEVQRASWIEVLPSDRVREIAEALPEQYELRALDSFQLAAALVWCKEQSRGRLFVCCAVRLADAATKAGFDVLR